MATHYRRRVTSKTLWLDNNEKLIDLILTLPAHSAYAERGFSEMKLVKSDWRSCLRPSILSDLLFIMLHAYDIPSYDPTDAINLWNLTGQRTRGSSQRPYGSRPDDGDAGDDDVSSDDNTDILSSL